MDTHSNYSVCHFLFSSPPMKFAANHTLSEDAVDTSFGTNDPISCRADGSFCEDTTLMFDPFMLASHKELPNVVASWDDNRELFSRVNCCMLEPSPYPQKSLFIHVRVQLS